MTYFSKHYSQKVVQSLLRRWYWSCTVSPNAGVIFTCRDTSKWHVWWCHQGSHGVPCTSSLRPHHGQGRRRSGHRLNVHLVAHMPLQLPYHPLQRVVVHPTLRQPQPPAPRPAREKVVTPGTIAPPPLPDILWLSIHMNIVDFINKSGSI